jgi:hypothetical protein
LVEETQLFPQVPQLWMSFCSSTHLPLQHTLPTAQSGHVPPLELLELDDVLLELDVVLLELDVVMPIQHARQVLL